MRLNQELMTQPMLSLRSLTLVGAAALLVHPHRVYAQSPMLTQRAACGAACPGETRAAAGPSPVNPYVQVGAELGYMFREADFPDNLLTAARAQYQLGGKQWQEKHPKLAVFAIGNFGDLKKAALKNPAEIEESARKMLASDDGINAMLAVAWQSMNIRSRVDDDTKAAGVNVVVWPSVGYKLSLAEDPADSTSTMALNQLHAGLGLELHLYAKLKELPITLGTEGTYSKCVTNAHVCKDLFGANDEGRGTIQGSFYFPLIYIPRLTDTIELFEKWFFLVEAAGAAKSKPLLRSGFAILK